MEVTPYINYRGDCEAAFRLYEQCFGGKIVAMFPWGEAPEDPGVPPDWKKKVMHARIEFDHVHIVSLFRGRPRPRAPILRWAPPPHPRVCVFAKAPPSRAR